MQFFFNARKKSGIPTQLSQNDAHLFSIWCTHLNYKCTFCQRLPQPHRESEPNRAVSIKREQKQSRKY